MASVRVRCLQAEWAGCHWVCLRAYSGDVTLSNPEELQLSTIESLRDASQETALPAEDVSAQMAQQAQPDELRPERPARRRLSPEQQHEIARLYADSTIPTSEIRQRFGIGESSLYRIVQREGVPLRGRAAAPSQSGPSRAQTPESGRRRSPTASRAQAPAGQPRVGAVAAPTGSSRRGGRGRATPSASGGASAPGSTSRGQFRIQFRGERVIEARDIRDALRQAESLGATEVTAVTRED